ncbi:MAG: hypothetical protein LQ340_003769 [Diploschistes diacapsis]|nr:MAG: hypothetical protein LQ340_003769 [Diploschistes diacapsis]
MAVPSRPRTPSKSDVPSMLQSPPIPSNENAVPQGQRRPSFSFLRRGKSVERLNSKRSVSGGKLQKKHSKSETRDSSDIADRAPRIPDLATQPQFATFGGEAAAASSSNTPQRLPNQPQVMTGRSSPYAIPVPQIPTSPKKADFDPYARSESMTNRGRYSYASSAVSTLSSPRRVRRRKDPTPFKYVTTNSQTSVLVNVFSVLVIGARSSGKTSFVDFLRSSLALPSRKQRPHPRDDDFDVPSQNRYTTKFTSQYLETEVDSERIGLTLWDSEGLEKSMVDLQVREIIGFLESKFEETLSEEIKVIRSPGGVKDSHIHCVLLLLDPLNLNHTLSAAKQAHEAGYNGSFSNGKSYLRDTSPETLSGLDENLDLQVLRALQGKTTVVPVISKADTITIDRMLSLKRAVWKSLKAEKFDSFEALGLEDDSDADEDAQAAENVKEYVDAEATPRGNRSKHARHDSKRFNEADEDDLARSERPDMLHPETSHLETASSSSGSSFNVTDAPQRPYRQTHPNQPEPPSRHLGPSASDASSNPIPSIPFSVLTPDPIITPHQAAPGQTGRKFAWGFADPYDAEHCDFTRLRDAIFKDWFGELREASREVWYEEWRASRLNNRSPRAFNQSRSQGDSRTSNNTRQGMVPASTPGNNSLGRQTANASKVGPRVPSGASSVRASPNPQTFTMPGAYDVEVGVAR